jgi:hypothetical protein
MDALLPSLAVLWVLACFAVVGLCLPTIALAATTSGDRRWASAAGPALVWTWLTMAILVPAIVALRGFNWINALLIAATWPSALWWWRHRGHHRAAFRTIRRRVVFRAVDGRRLRPQRTTVRAVAGGVTAGLLLAAGFLVAMDVRLPVPADFDTFSRARQLLDGQSLWDPLASLALVMSRVSTTDTLTTLAAMRVALVVLTAAAAGVLLSEIVATGAGVGVAPIVVVLAAPWAPLTSWAIAFVVIVGATALIRTIRHPHSPDEWWHVLAALALAAGHVAPFWDRPDVLWEVTRTARYLEHQSAARETLRLARTADADWILVGAPEQQLELDGRGGFIDQAQFVSRFEDRAGRPHFRFDLPVRRLYVLVEKEPFDVSRAVTGVRFVVDQPAAYRVPGERARLASRVRRVCDDYRRTHPETAVVYDDAVLRIYRIEL